METARRHKHCPRQCRLTSRGRPKPPLQQSTKPRFGRRTRVPERDSLPRSLPQQASLHTVDRSRLSGRRGTQVSRSFGRCILPVVGCRLRKFRLSSWEPSRGFAEGKALSRRLLVLWPVTAGTKRFPCRFRERWGTVL